MKRRISDLIKALFFSLLSYMSVLAVIIALDTFNSKDFVFERVLIISVAFMGAILIFFAVMFLVFRTKIASL